MDIVLERVLSLIEKDETGKYAYGAKVKFAKSIGYNDGSIVSMWENGTSTSYIKKLHEIADVYHVSVSWLRGETDDPNIKNAPGQKAEDYTEQQKAAIKFVMSLPDEQLRQFIKVGRAMYGDNKDD